MKKNLFIVCLSIVSFTNVTVAQQTYNPYKSLGKEAKVLTLSNGKYQEFFDMDTIEIIGSAILNTKTMTVIGFYVPDTLYSESTLEPEIVSRWLSLDPLAAKYPSMSPYNFVANNPIIYVDVDGRDFIVKNKGDRDLVKAALVLVYGSEDAFSFDKKGKLSIDQSKIHGLSNEQSYTLNKLSEGIVNNSDIQFNVKLSDKGVTSVESYTDEKGNIIESNVNININQPDFNDKLKDTDDGNIKKGDPNYQATDIEKRAVGILHEAGHVIEDQAGNKIGTPTNERKTVGFENKIRTILGLNQRVGNLHGEKQKDGTYDPKYTGVEEPSK